MSVNAETNVHCKMCGDGQPFMTWSTVNATKNPELRLKLLKGELTRFVCRRCGWSGDVLYPLLYHDMNRRFMVWLWPEPGEPDLAGAPTDKLSDDYRLRVVSSRNELVEKILLFEHQMDDRVIEAVKLRVWAQAAEEGKPYEGLLFYSKTVKDEKEMMQFHHLKASETESLTVPFEFYQRTRQALTSRLLSGEAARRKWLRIDKEYAKTLAL